MKYENISPSGYQYTKEPKSTHPFWVDGGGEAEKSPLTYTSSSIDASSFSAYKVEPGRYGTYKFNFEFHIQYEYNELTYSKSFNKQITYTITTDNIDFSQALDFIDGFVLPLEYENNKYLPALINVYIQFYYDSNTFNLSGINVSINDIKNIKYLVIELLNVSVEVI